MATKLKSGDIVVFKAKSLRMPGEPKPKFRVDGFCEDAMGHLYAALTRLEDGKPCGTAKAGSLRHAD